VVHVLFWTLAPPLLMMLELHVLAPPEARAAVRASQEELWKLWAGVLAAVLLVGRRSP
jgi:hypothetical protein